MRPAALIFDVFGTLVDWRSGVSREVAAAFARKNAPVDAVAFADAWRAEYQPAMERIRSQSRGYLPLDDLHFENLQRVLNRLGKPVRFDEAELWALNAAWEKLPPWPDVAPGLKRLRAKFLLAPCSNGSIALMTRLARFGGLSFDCVLGADIARDYKPKPEVYRASAAALRLPPERVMMVAAHEDDLHAARRAGLATAFIPRPDEHGPGASPTEPTAEWEATAESLLALADRLGA